MTEWEIEARKLLKLAANALEHAGDKHSGSALVLILREFLEPSTDALPAPDDDDIFGLT